MAQFIEEVPLEEILKAKFRRLGMKYKEARELLLTAMIKVAMVKHKGIIKDAMKELGINEKTYFRFTNMHNRRLHNMFKNGYAHGVDMSKMLKIPNFKRYRMSIDGKEVISMRSFRALKKIGKKTKGMVSLRADNGISTKRSIKKLYKECLEYEENKKVKTSSYEGV